MVRAQHTHTRTHAHTTHTHSQHAAQRQTSDRTRPAGHGHRAAGSPDVVPGLSNLWDYVLDLEHLQRLGPSFAAAGLRWSSRYPAWLCVVKAQLWLWAMDRRLNPMAPPPLGHYFAQQVGCATNTDEPNKNKQQTAKAKKTKKKRTNRGIRPAATSQTQTHTHTHKHTQTNKQTSTTKQEQTAPPCALRRRVAPIGHAASSPGRRKRCPLKTCGKTSAGSARPSSPGRVVRALGGWVGGWAVSVGLGLGRSRSRRQRQPAVSQPGISQPASASQEASQRGVPPASQPSPASQQTGQLACYWLERAC